MQITALPLPLIHQARLLARDYATHTSATPKRQVKPKSEPCATSTAVLDSIASGHNYQGAIIERTGLSKFAVQSALRRLQHASRIKVENKIKRGSTWTNIYKQTDEAAK